MIPRIIHQIWIGGKYPENWKKCCAEIKQKHPDWEYKFWNDDDCQELIDGLTDKGKEFYQEMIKIKKWAWAVDLLRYVAVYKYGGVYLDCDFKMTPNGTLNSLPLENDLILINQIRKEYVFYRLNNCFLAAKPNQEFIKILIDNIRNVKYTLTGVSSRAPLELYNCQYLTTEYYYRMHPEEEKINPKNCFYPEKIVEIEKEKIIDHGFLMGKNATICMHIGALTHLTTKQRLIYKKKQKIAFSKSKK